MRAFEYIPRTVADIIALRDNGTVDDVLIYAPGEFIGWAIENLNNKCEYNTVALGWEDFENSGYFLLQDCYKKGDLKQNNGEFANILIVCL